MCELLGLSASEPVDVTVSFGHLAAHGGLDGQPDGWGLAFLEGTDAQVWRDPHAAATSPFARFLTSEPVTGSVVMAHIRRATLGAVQLSNTQPFIRELFGRVHVFAHNGSLPAIGPVGPDGWLRPLGETDSEAAFCQMLNDMALTGDDPEALRDVFVQTARRLRCLGHANLLYASGDRLFVHSDFRAVLPDPALHPGLWIVERDCAAAGGHTATSALSVEGEPLHTAIVASVPLTAEAWRPLERGTILEIRRGQIVYTKRLDVAG